MGSTLSIECPPATGMPAAAQTEAPPCSTRPMVRGDRTFTGMPTSASAMIGVPPMA